MTRIPATRLPAWGAALRRLTLTVVAATLLPLAALAQATGAIAGRVFNPANGEYVRNAEVRLQGTQQTVFTEEGGYYRLANVPAGETTVTVSYSGAETATAKVNVTAGATATRDFELAGTAAAPRRGDEPVKLEAFTVSTEREGNAKAIMEQKSAMNVKNVVAADSFGDIAEGNVGEFLKFMPGIVLDYVETDTRAARMGGLEARYGAVTLDGGGMANTGTGTFGDNTRQFEFEAISINNIEAIEVNKTLSADMSADAPAGTINLRSRSALDRKGQQFNFSVGFIGNQYEHSIKRTPRHDDARHAKLRPTLTFDYSNKFLGDKLGVSVNGAFTSVFKEQFRHSLTYDYNSAQAIAAGSPLITAINFKDGPKMTDKSSGGLKLDYEPFRGLRLTLASSYTYFADEIANRNLNFRVSAAQLGAGSNMVRLVANPSGANANTRIEQSGGHGDKKTDTTNLSLGFVWRKNSFTIDGQSSYSRARQQNGSDHLGSLATADLQLTRIGYTATRPSVDSPEWTFTQTSGGNWFDLNSYGRNDAQTGNISSSRSRSKTQQFVQQANVRFVTPWREYPTFFKGGLFSKLTVRDREQLTAYNASWVGPTGSSLTSPMPASIADFRIGPAWGGNIYSLPVPDKSALLQLVRNNPTYFAQTPTQAADNLNTILGSNQDVEETVNAAYGLANTRVGRWQFQAGLRYEKTTTENKVIERVPDARNPFPANTIARINYRYSLGRTTNEGEYDAWLPSASAVYKIKGDLQLKLGYHRAIQRPNLAQLAGQWAIDEANLEIQIPNPTLSPTFSDKYSAVLEYYFEPAGSLSLHAFQTDLKGDTQETSPAPASEFGYGNDPVYGAYDFTTFYNIPGKRVVRGAELSYRQTLKFFRSEFLRGTTVFASYSQNSSTPRPGGFVPRSATGGVFFRYRKFNANLAGTWNDAIRTGSNTVGGTSRYFAGDVEFLKERYLFDVGLGWKLNRHLDLFLSGRNAFNSGKTWVFKNSDGRIRQMERYGGQWTIGVRGHY
jgi:iron complex outermembrane receptor protein